jgi:hypothetical protein
MYLYFPDTPRTSWAAKPLKMGPIGRPETSAWNYYSTLRNIPEESSSCKISNYLKVPYVQSLRLAGCVNSEYQNTENYAASWTWPQYAGTAVQPANVRALHYVLQQVQWLPRNIAPRKWDAVRTDVLQCCFNYWDSFPLRDRSGWVCVWGGGVCSEFVRRL